MNVQLVSKTVPNRDYFLEKLKELDEYDTSEANREATLMTSEQLMIYIARVSSSRDNKLEDYDKLLNFLIEHGHWSPFEHAYMTVEIETSRAIGRQLLRHRSFTFQEFSQRYSSDIEFENFELREQPEENRQSSSDKLATIMHNAYTGEDGFQYRYPDGGEVDNNLNKFKATNNTTSVLDELEDLYNQLIDAGVASETARMILPECTRTTLYMKGSIRSWLSYFNIRLKENTQKEHRKVAEKIAKIFSNEFPVITESTETFNDWNGNFM